MPIPTKCALFGGAFQDSSGAVLKNGYLRMFLSQDANVPGVGNVCSGIYVQIALDINGNVVTNPTQAIWGNDVLVPTNTFYRVFGYTASGQLAFGPNNQQVIGSSFDVGTWIPNSVISWQPPIQPLTIEVNSVLAGSQTLLNLTAGSGVTLVDNGSGGVSISASGGPTFNTTNAGWIWSSGTGLYGSGPTSETYSAYTGVANTILCYQMIVPFSLTIRKVDISVSGTAAGQSINAGIYTFDGNTKLMDVSFSTTAAGVKTATLGTPLVLLPGIYWFAFSNTGQPNVTFGPQFSLGATSLIPMLNANTTRVGQAGNITIGGVMPSTLGAISAFSGSLPIFLFEV